MIRIGIAGLGFMGMIHYLAARKLRGAKVVAIWSRDPKKLVGDWTSIRGNFGPAGAQMDLSGVRCYADYAELLADKAVDLVDITTPTDCHPSMTLAALRAGKHVFVEKAIALTQRDADGMVAAASKAGKLLMVGHVLPFFPEFAFAADVIGKGTYGKLLGGHFTRVIAKPDWSAAMADASKTGGPAVDLHIHDAHFISLIAGVPSKVFATGVEHKDGSVDYLTTQYLYGTDGPVITCSSGAVAQATRPFVHGFEIYLEQATLSYSSAGMPLTVFPAKGQVKVPKLKGGTEATSAFTAELQAAVDGIAAGVAPRLLSGQLARDALVLCHKECQSVRTGKIVNMK